jgi:hypothetical protein
MKMKLDMTPEDDPAFVRVVASIVDSVVSECTPEIVTVIHIKNWFDSKWLNFSGKVLGALGVWKDELTLPPFNPNRVLCQTVLRLSAGEYQPIEAPPLHVVQPSAENLSRRVERATDSGAFAWWSSNTVANGKGSLMVYTQIGDLSSAWFLGFHKKAEWEISKKVGIPDALIKKYMGGVEQRPEPYKK